MKIAVECYPDEAVLRGLGVPKRQVLHQARKGEVFNWLKKTAGGIGVVDDDPARYQLPGTAKQLKDIPRYEQKEGLRRFPAALSECDKGMSVLRQWIFHG